MSAKVNGIFWRHNLKFMDLYFPHKSVGWSVALLLTLGLAGCGGGEGGGDNSPLPPSPDTQVQVVDGFSVVKPNERTQLDFSSFVRGRGAILASIASEQSECDVGSVSGLRADVTNRGTTLCQYRFTARNGNSEGSATLSVLSTLAVTPALEPLSVAMTISDFSKTLDVVSMYGASLPEGYLLKSNSVTVQGGNVQGTATQSGNSITYISPSAPDWNRVSFILENPAKVGEDILGTLYITISESVNQAPTINNTKLHYINHIPPYLKPKTFEMRTLDLANLYGLLITDPEGKEWQLIEVQSYSASVASAAPNDVTNKKFTFQAGVPGEHIVSYIVGDHEGGYRMGLIHIEVAPKEQTKDWSDIDMLSTAGLYFYAPPLFSELKSKLPPDFFVNPVWDADVNQMTGNTIGSVSGKLTAQSFCSGRRLASRADLDALRNATEFAGDVAKYPKANTYLVVDNEAYTGLSTYNLKNGAVGVFGGLGSDPSQYVMCVGDSYISYVPNPDSPIVGLTDTTLSNRTWQTIGYITSTAGVAAPYMLDEPTNMGSGNLGVHNFRIIPDGCPSGECKLEAFGDSDEFGHAKIYIANIQKPESPISIDTRFIQDVRVAAAEVVYDNAVADGVSTNTMVFKLENNDGRPVPAGTVVKLLFSVTAPDGMSFEIKGMNNPKHVDTDSRVAFEIAATSAIDGKLTVKPVIYGGIPVLSGGSPEVVVSFFGTNSPST